MGKILALLVIVCIALCMVVSYASADRLLLIPTGTTLSTGGVKVQAALSTENDNAKVYWANLGISRFEVEGARFQDFGPETLDAISAQVSVMPETSFTPAVALGVRDISDETKDEGALYNGQSIYLAVSKGVPVTGGIPILFQDVKIHGGIGTGSLSGIFFGVQGTLPMGLQVMGEFDTEDFNFGAAYNIAPMLKIQAESLKGDFYYGATFSTSF